MTPGTKTTIWILEDDKIFATQMRKLLGSEADLDCPYHFSNSDELFEKLRFTKERPEVLLLDLGLPRRDGLQVLSEIRAALPDIKVLILSSYDDKERVYRAICNGASGYLLKTADADDIISGVRDVIAGSAALSAPIAKMILQGFSSHGPVQQLEQLTSREEDVLRLLVRGLIKKEIADQLDISQHTVDMHLRSVYRKLQVRSQTEAVSKALRQGIV
ncbi:response regulator transcription factor [Luteolibacter pohnpeiensis]|uniref:Response regulator transcription factor n=1 Tax=Luteolibacter pohnpeiensis TaxID=454153 RepID=A0A934VRK1_9BACT|nr:response regulator transcription factor [Luteolibacter pohnpeiensis]MBK1883296.1 response regulator transcription factor [Luteolibacter pohnpeiensis]